MIILSILIALKTVDYTSILFFYTPDYNGLGLGLTVYMVSLTSLITVSVTVNLIQANNCTLTL